MYLCNNCGADMRFDVSSQMLVCDYCLSRISIKDYEDNKAACAGTEPLSGQEGRETWQAHLCTCPQCGGTLLTYEESAATFCSFCGASVILESRISNERQPDAVIPFSVTKEECEAAYKKLLRKNLFVPNSMKKEEEIERFRGIYMPYWVYSFSSDGPVAAAGRRVIRKGDYEITENYRITADVKADFTGISYDASSSFADNLSQAIAPFDFGESRKFNTAYLSGFYADSNDIDSVVYLDDAKNLARDYEASVLRQDKTYASYNSSDADIKKGINFTEKEPELAMFPVWFLASRSKNGGRVNYAVVNGQTGKAAADLPVDWKKLLIGTLILAVPLFIIFNIAWTLTPDVLLALDFVLSLAAYFIANRQLNRVYTYENRINDKGYQSKAGAQWNLKEKKKFSLHKLGSFGIIVIGIFLIYASAAVSEAFGNLITTLVIFFWIFYFTVGRKKKPKKPAETVKYVKAPFKKKLKVLIKPLLSVIISLIVINVSPVYDAYYYAACIITMLLTAWCFVEIILMRNRLCGRPLDQFKKRGGEAYEKY